MGREALGRFLISSKEIPASSDAAKFFHLFTAPGVPVEVHFIQFYGGDAGEMIQLTLLPPTITSNGTLGPVDVAGTIAITPAEYMQGATGTLAKPMALGSDNGGRGAPRFTKFIVPPDYQIAMIQDTANTAAWSVTVGGFELVQGW
jgi:hypothetical protein